MKAFAVFQFLLTISMAVGFQNAMPKVTLYGSVTNNNHLLRSTVSSSSNEETKVSNRRKFMNGVAATITTILSVPSLATAAEEDAKLTDVYFGVGCFWHIQHEFVVAEKNLLGRGPKTFTSRTGYAGGTKTDNGKVRIVQQYIYIYIYENNDTRQPTEYSQP